MKELHEKQDLNYNGTIIDIETIGDTVKGYPKYDSREFNQVKIVIFGFISAKSLHIYCAEGNNDIDHLKEFIKATITPESASPLFAYNSHYEMGTIYHHYGLKIPFDYELQATEYMRKEDYMKQLGIHENFNDPFNYPPNRGLQCRLSWQNGGYENAMRHNRACLLKEQAIMLTKTYKPIIPFSFNDDLKPNIYNQGQSFKPWTDIQRNSLKTLWNEGKSISICATKLDRSPKGIYMQLQKLGMIPNNLLYGNDKNAANKYNLK